LDFESVAAALCRDKFLDGETGLRVLCRSRAFRFAGGMNPNAFKDSKLMDPHILLVLSKQMF
jgi:hypothetical protein